MEEAILHQPQSQMVFKIRLLTNIIYMLGADLEVEAGSVCTCSWPADCTAACHTGGSASAQGACSSHSSHHLVCGSHSPGEKKNKVYF